MKRIILLFGLIFSLVAVTANAGEAPTNQEKAKSHALQMKKALSLTEEQTIKAEAIILSKLTETEAVINDLNLDGAGKTSALEAIRVKKDAEFQAVFTPAQYQEFLAKREQSKQRKEQTK